MGCLALLLRLGIAPLASMAADYAWPREIVTPNASVTRHQPQPDKLQGNHLTARAASSILTKECAEPIFGG